MSSPCISPLSRINRFQCDLGPKNITRNPGFFDFLRGHQVYVFVPNPESRFQRETCELLPLFSGFYHERSSCNFSLLNEEVLSVHLNGKWQIDQDVPSKKEMADQLRQHPAVKHMGPFRGKPLFQACGCGLREKLHPLFLSTQGLHFAYH